MTAFSNLPLEDGRNGFLKWIDTSRPQGSLNNRVTVVFDGQPDCFGGELRQGDVRVIFSDGCSADDKIKLMVEEAEDKKNCVVVSNDKDIYLYARSLGTKVMTVAAFTSKRETLRVSEDSGGKYIPLSRQEKINKELRALWLKEK